MKHVLITGAASPEGIGWATALRFAREGFHVIVTGISDAEIKRTPAHPQIKPVILDVRDNAAVVSLFNGLDQLDALVNCAGGSPDHARQHTVDGFVDSVDLNLNGAMRCAFAARALLEKTQGAIVNIASMYAYFGSSMVPAYSAAKGGIIQLTKSLAIAYAPAVRVNAVAPGWIKTGMARPVWEDPVWAPQITARTPAGRFGEPAELADPIYFLCSDDSRFINGVTIPVDGGYCCVG